MGSLDQLPLLLAPTSLPPACLLLINAWSLGSPIIYGAWPASGPGSESRFILRKTGPDPTLEEGDCGLKETAAWPSIVWATLGASG